MLWKIRAGLAMPSAVEICTSIGTFASLAT
jgi:hypothetical protein